MNKILNVALTATFPGLNIEVLLEVVNATPNAVTATEILLDIYELPIINETVHVDYLKDYQSKSNFKLISYDKFKDEVKYSYQTKESKDYWCKVGNIIPLYEDATNPKFLKYDIAEAAEEVGISLQDFKEQYQRRNIYGPLRQDNFVDTMPLILWNTGKRRII